MATAEIKESEYKVWERVSSVVEKIREEVSGIVISNYSLIYALAADAETLPISSSAEMLPSSLSRLRDPTKSLLPMTVSRRTLSILMH